MKQQKQSGFAHLVIITVILGLAVVGLLGFVFWQNFMQPKDNVAKTGDSSKVVEKDDNKSPDPVVEDKNTLKIAEWGIKGIYKGSHPIKYTIGADSKYYYSSFTSDDLTGTCAGWTVATIARYTGDLLVKEVVPWSFNETRTIAEVYAVDGISEWGGNKRIGEYYYVYISPHQGCAAMESDSNNSISAQVSNDVHEYFKTLEAI